MLIKPHASARRDFLRAGMYAVGISAGLPSLFEQLSLAQVAKAASGDEKHPNRILVVLELSGGNDGLNTVVPFEDDAYHIPQGAPEAPRLKESGTQTE